MTKVRGLISRYKNQVVLSSGGLQYDASRFEEFVGQEVYAEVSYYEAPTVVSSGDDFGYVHGTVAQVTPV